MPWRETPDPELFEELLEGVQSRQQTRFDGTDPRPSEFCSECACPPFRPHEPECTHA